MNLLSKSSKSTSHSASSRWRRVITAAGIFLFTFGLLGWQLKAFNQRLQRETQDAEQQTQTTPPPDTHWHEAPKAVREAVAKTIRSQLNALQHGQYARGLQLHSRAVQQEFSNTNEFQKLIETRFAPMISNQKSVFWFVNTDTKRHFANAGVTISGSQNDSLEVVYQLVFENEEWRISGIAKRPPRATK